VAGSKDLDIRTEHEVQLVRKTVVTVHLRKSLIDGTGHYGMGHDRTG